VKTALKLKVENCPRVGLSNYRHILFQTGRQLLRAGGAHPKEDNATTPTRGKPLKVSSNRNCKKTTWEKESNQPAGKICMVRSAFRCSEELSSRPHLMLKKWPATMLSGPEFCNIIDILI